MLFHRGWKLAMKFFHLSDLHIGLKLMGYDLQEDQRHILRQIAEYAGREQPDAVVIAGDVYDKSIPSAEAASLFDDFISALVREAPESTVMIISGNHDSAARLNLFRSVLSSRKIHMIGLPPMQPEEHIEKVTLTDEHGPVHFYLLPFIKPSMVKPIVGVKEDGTLLSYDASLRGMIEREAIDTSARNVLVSHQFYLPSGTDPDTVERADSEIRTVGNIDEVSAQVLAPFDYAALGHIHKPMTVGDPFRRYSGTPIACSVSEAGQEKGIIVVEMKEKGMINARMLPLSPLRGVRVIRGTLQEVLAQACGDYVTVVLTDAAETAGPDLIDRLSGAFPYLMEVRREGLRSADYTSLFQPEQMPDPFELCCSFLKNADDTEKDLLRDVINTVCGTGRL